MRFDARTDGRKRASKMVVRRPDGTQVKFAFAFDTEEGWVDVFETTAEGKPAMTPWAPKEGGGAQRDFITKRLTEDFDVVDTKTGEVLASHRAKAERQP